MKTTNGVFIFFKLFLSFSLPNVFCHEGISLVDESVNVESGVRTEIAPGIHTAYDLPVDEDIGHVASDQVDTTVSLEELMAQMKSM